jgi:hypothetical protein
MKRTNLLLCISVIVVFILWVTTVFAFEVCRTQEQGYEMQWSTSSVKYWVNTTGGPSGSYSAIISAMDTWTNVNTSIFTFSYEGTSSIPNQKSDGKNVVGFTSFTSSGIPLSLGMSYIWYYPSGEIIETDIFLNTDYPLATDMSLNSFDVQNMVTHELGHSLCLEDLYSVSDSEKTMYGLMSKGETKKRTLDQDDINGITYLYPGVQTGTLLLPIGQNSYFYPPVTDPVKSINPAMAKPVGVGSVATGGYLFGLHIALEQFSGPVDIYGAYSLSSDPQIIFNLKPDLSFQAFSTQEIIQALATGQPPAGAVPWKHNVTGPIDEFPLGNIPLSSIPSGTYNLYLLVTQVGSLNAYYLWNTYFVVP